MNNNQSFNFMIPFKLKTGTRSCVRNQLSNSILKKINLIGIHVLRSNCLFDIFSNNRFQ